MILSRSPYYVITQPLITGNDSVVIELKIWRGDKVNDEPVNNTSVFTLQKPSANINVLSKDIAPHIRDFFFVNVNHFQAGVQYQNSQVWIKTTIIYGDNTTADDVNVDYATEGYSTYLDGANYSKVGILQNHKSGKAIKKVLDIGFTIIAFNYDQEITVKTTKNTGQEITNDTLQNFTQSSTQIKYIVLNNSLYDNKINVNVINTQSSNVIDTFTYSVVCENKFEPNNIVFKNKFGAFENIYFFKKSTQSLNVENEEFQANMINTNGTYDTTRHQFKYYNTNTKRSLNLTSGYVDEAMNETFAQLMSSNVIYLQVDNRLIPLNISTTNKEFSSERVDQKISYDFEFEFAFNEINTM